MVFSKVIIITPSFEQRVSKMAYELTSAGYKCEVLAEEAQVADEFKNYVESIPFSVIPCSQKLRRTPLGRERIRFIRDKVRQAVKSESGVLIIARDVNYGSIVLSAVRPLKSDNIRIVTDVADNYDLIYASYGNPLKKVILRLGFSYLTKKAFRKSDALLVVTPVNIPRIRERYPFTTDKPIFVLRNLPLGYRFIKNEEKLPKSMVYIGKIDEISRDPFYVLDNLTAMEDYTLHFYSSQKAATISAIRKAADEKGISDRVIFHERVPYDMLAEEISKYSVGLVPHKRSPVTDYTVPNKIYDYKSSGVVTVMSDCPALVYENDAFRFGLVYSREKNNFADVIKEAESYDLDFSVEMPDWNTEFSDVLNELKNI